MKSIILLVSTSCLLCSCSVLNWWQTQAPDNPAEEALEKLIEDKTGKRVDLTPLTGDERMDRNGDIKNG